MIDENLVRGVLSDDQRNDLLARRKQLYEEEHPQTKRGAAPGRAGGGKRKREDGQNDRLGTEPFTKKVAKMTGKHESTVRRQVAKGKAKAAVKGSEAEWRSE
jgi:hypothetical protein